MKKYLLLTTIALIASWEGKMAYAEAPFSFSTTPGQLPKNVVPSYYDLDLRLDPQALLMKGHEAVTIDVSSPTRSITLNQAGLQIFHVSCDDQSAKAVIKDDKQQTATFRFVHPLRRGKHILRLDYTGPILDTPNGLYHDDYQDAEGHTHRLLVTQFEVADARRMLPVWDEPAFKARFDVTVTLPAYEHAVSNMPIARERAIGAGWKSVFFQTTPRMSSYLLAFVAGDISSVRTESSGVDLSVYAPSGRQSQGDYALHAAADILPYYNDYFGVRYPLPKMDMLAIPGNYQAGAMENWGALTYIDNYLLFDPKNSTPYTGEMIYEVVAHEMAHQWSGDLVTMGWWNNLWLNEGFASWMEIKAADKFNPEWQLWPRQHATREATMAVDALSTTHPIQQPIHNVEEAETVFDNISYGKGEQVIRMLEGWLGEENFRDGMRRYMRDHAYGNTTSQDLWNALSFVSGRDVTNVARSFTEQKGFPQINVSLTCHNNKGIYKITQKRFTIHDRNAQPLFWDIPIVSRNFYGKPQTSVLKGNSSLSFIGSCDKPWIFNEGESGYYRVNYDKVSFSLIKKNFNALSPVDQVNILGDQYALFSSGQKTLDFYFNLLGGLPDSQKKNISLVDEMFDRFTELDQFEQNKASQPEFHKFVQRILMPIFQKVGWDQKQGESELDAIMRPRLITMLGLAEDPAIIQEVMKRFKQWSNAPESLSPTLVGPVTLLVARHADEAIWSLLVDRLQNATSTEVKLRLFNALSYVTNPQLIEKTIHLAYSGVIPNGRIDRVLAIIGAHSGDPQFAWQIIVQHKQEIRQHLTPDAQNVFLADIARYVGGAEVISDLKEDARQRHNRGTDIATARALETIEAREELKLRAVKQFDAWEKGHEQ
ncbi:M1 family peptidase [Saccharibacter sp. 17.LH.SD]|uniref:M1 family metallopeptidase n=1 Tax=Saccharibacter sp. 17.LH.SD TaxID=2689393 RepID=UPI00136995EE|nr:M1 family metallopeptidase [Saccharibacter sp. 17.LH.SD]MXV43944.1 M1 family peptidase [Saccharibacter sp. 17.LH.SD]